MRVILALREGDGVRCEPAERLALERVHPGFDVGRRRVCAVVDSNAFWNPLAAVQMCVEGCLLSPLSTFGAYLSIALWNSFSDAVCVGSSPFVTMYGNE